MEALVEQHNRSASIGKRFDYVALAPAAAALCYPFLLRAFHAVVGTQAVAPSPSAIAQRDPRSWPIAFLVPFLGLALACRPTANTGARRLAYASVTAPTLYVFLGVVQALVHSPIPDEIVWCVIWLAIAIWSQRARNPVAAASARSRALARRPWADGGDPLPLRVVPYHQSPVRPGWPRCSCRRHEDRTRGLPLRRR